MQKKAIHEARSNVIGGWMPPQRDLKRTNDLMLDAVQSQHFNGNPANGGDARHLVSLPSEVMIPRLLPGMEQRCQPASLRVASVSARAFAQGAVDAGEREILQHRAAASDDRLDVIDMESASLPELRQPAVFAPVARTRSHESAKSCRHRHTSGAVRVDLSTELEQ